MTTRTLRREAGCYISSALGQNTSDNKRATTVENHSTEEGDI
jgi:hypothetical protein